MLEGHLAQMRQAYGLTKAVGGTEQLVRGEGFFARNGWKGTEEYYNALARSDRLIMKNVTAPERLSAKLAERVTAKQWKAFAKIAEKRGVKILVGVGSVCLAVQGFNEARADGAPPQAAAAVGVIEAVNPLPWSSIEIKNDLADAATNAQSWANAWNDDVNNNRGLDDELLNSASWGARK